jgi:hypothetical protein
LVSGHSGVDRFNFSLDIFNLGGESLNLGGDFSKELVFEILNLLGNVLFD